MTAVLKASLLCLRRKGCKRESKPINSVTAFDCLNLFGAQRAGLKQNFCSERRMSSLRNYEPAAVVKGMQSCNSSSGSIHVLQLCVNITAEYSCNRHWKMILVTDLCI